MNNLDLTGAALWLVLSLGAGLLLLLIYPLLASRWRQPLLLVRWVLFPYLGLITGGLSPRLMGLTGINWLASFGLGLGLVGMLLALLILVRTIVNVSHAPGMEQAGRLAQGGRAVPLSSLPTHPTQLSGYPVWNLWPALQIGAEEFHWAFLRGALWESLLLYGFAPLQANYWAMWAALLLALPATIRYQPSPALQLTKGVMLLLTTVLFFYTRNFWLCWFLHSIAWSILNPMHLPRTFATTPT